MPKLKLKKPIPFSFVLGALDAELPSLRRIRMFEETRSADREDAGAEKIQDDGKENADLRVAESLRLLDRRHGHAAALVAQNHDESGGRGQWVRR